MGDPLIANPFSPWGSYFLLICMIRSPENLAQGMQVVGFSHAGVQLSDCGLRLWLNRIVGCTLFVARAQPAVVSSQGNRLSVSFFLTVFGSASGSWEGSVFEPSLGMHLCLWGMLALFKLKRFFNFLIGQDI